MGMQDIPGVNCCCLPSVDAVWPHENQASEIIVPEEHEPECESVPGRIETDDGGKDSCGECGSDLEWKLRLDGATVRVCPNC